MKYIALILFVLLTGVNAFAQRKPIEIITGKVTNTAGEPIGYASANSGDSIIFTHIGYKRVAKLIEGNNVINATMEKSVYEYGVFKVEEIADVARPAPAPKSDDLRFIFEKVEIYAAYKGGSTALKRYIDSTLKYPADAKEKNIEGRVVIGFTVGKSGVVKDVKVVKGIFPSCDEASMNMVKGMKNWTSALQNAGNPDLYIEIAIDFDLTLMTAS